MKPPKSKQCTCPRFTKRLEQAGDSYTKILRWFYELIRFKGYMKPWHSYQILETGVLIDLTLHTIYSEVYGHILRFYNKDGFVQYPKEDWEYEPFDGLISIYDLKLCTTTKF